MLNGLVGRTREHNEPSVTATQLSDQFGSVVTDVSRPETLVVAQGPPVQSAFHTFQPVTVEQVVKLLQSVNTHKATGSDGIPGLILKTFSSTIAPSLTKLMNLSLSKGCVPRVLKVAHVTPLFKGGDAKEPKNYRPVSLLPIISKLLEKLVHSQLSRYLDRTHGIPDVQFAFRHNHSTEACHRGNNNN